MRERFFAWQREVGETHALGVTRLAFGLLLFAQSLGAAETLAKQGYFGDSFHLPFLPEAWVASRALYTGIVATELLAAALVTVGYLARPALVVCASLGLYTILCDRLQYHHNRYALLCYAALLALTPCDHALSLGPERGRRGELWGMRLAALQVSIIYLASGGSKLLDDDWRGGLVLGDRFVRYGGMAIAKGVPEALVELSTRPWVASALAKAAIATELALAFALWGRRTRIVALYWGLLFHLTIQVTSNVELFTWTTLASYGLFVTPDTHARKLFFDPTRTRSVVAARLVRALDWFARFEVKPWSPDGLRDGHTLVVVRRDGSRATGVGALAMVARCVPALFLLWAPLALVASFTRGGETSTRT